jgi:excisionase family DNA binding protein
MLPVDPLSAPAEEGPAILAERSAPDAASAAPLHAAITAHAAPAHEAPRDTPPAGVPGGARPAGPRPPPRPRPAPSPSESRTRGPAPGQIRPTNGKNGKLPPQLTLDEVRDLVERERREALAVRDPIAIALAAERFNTLGTILADLPAQEAVDLYRPLLTVSQTAKMLGYNAKEVRRLLGQGKIAGRKVGSEWRIPLWAVL